MVGRSANERPLVAGKIEARNEVGSNLGDILLQLFAPAFLSGFAQVRLEQPIGIEPHVHVPVVVLAFLKSALFMFAGEQVADLQCEGQPPFISK